VNKHQLVRASVSYQAGLQGHSDQDDIIQDNDDGVADGADGADGSVPIDAVGVNITSGRKIIYKEMTTDCEEFIEAYQCLRDDFFTPIPANQQISFTQDEILTICATSNNHDILVNVKDFENLYISQPNSDDIYSYIMNGDYDSEIIFTGCESSASMMGLCVMLKSFSSLAFKGRIPPTTHSFWSC
jgi:hypothetical protein